MRPANKEFLDEIEAIPQEYLPALLEVVRGFRRAILSTGAGDSIRQGIKEALTGETLPISELWNEMG